MKPRTILFLLAVAVVLCATSVLAADTNTITFTNQAGAVVSNAHVLSHNAVDVFYEAPGGGLRVHLADLPPDLQAAFHYDPAAAASAQRQQQARQIAVNQARARAAAAQAQAAAQMAAIVRAQAAADMAASRAWVAAHPFIPGPGGAPQTVHVRIDDPRMPPGLVFGN
jgi:hypothetical protein